MNSVEVPGEHGVKYQGAGHPFFRTITLPVYELLKTMTGVAYIKEPTPVQARWLSMTLQVGEVWPKGSGC